MGERTKLGKHQNKQIIYATTVVITEVINGLFRYFIESWRDINYLYPKLCLLHVLAAADCNARCIWQIICYVYIYKEMSLMFGTNNKEASSRLQQNLFFFLQNCRHWILSCMSYTLTRFINSVFWDKGWKIQLSFLLNSLWTICELSLLFFIHLFVFILYLLY